MKSERITKKVAEQTGSYMASIILVNLIAQLGNEITPTVRIADSIWFSPRIDWLEKNTNLGFPSVLKVLNLLKEFEYIDKQVDGGKIFVCVNFEKLEGLDDEKVS